MQKELGYEYGTKKVYSVGFFLSLLLTYAAYAVVDWQLLKGTAATVVVVVLGSLQVILQIRCFLQMQERTDRFSRLFFYLTLLVSFLIIAGSSWIMYNLNYRMMPMGN